MKATKSQDGCRRFTVRVKHRVGRIDIINALRNHLDRSGEPMPRTRVHIMDAVRQVLVREGDTMWATAEDAPDLTAEQLQIIDRAFPELKDNVV